MRYCAVLLCLLASVHAAAQSPGPAPVQAVPKVDLERYLGAWYEVAAIPQFFQRQCVRDTQATYSKTGSEQFEVRNACTTQEDTVSVATGRARVADTQSNAKLEVTFLSLFGSWLFWIGGDYWVIGLEDNYQWAVVGHPTRNYAWVLARSRSLDAAAWAQIDAVLEKNGYDRCTLLISPQTGGDARKRPLCNR